MLRFFAHVFFLETIFYFLLRMFVLCVFLEIRTITLNFNVCHDCFSFHLDEVQGNPQLLLERLLLRSFFAPAAADNTNIIMSKPFDYSKWDNIEISDDEEDCHPNIEKESWFRMKHRSRVEREEREEKDKQQKRAQMKTNNIRIQEIKRTLKDIESNKDDDSDDELEDVAGLEAEIKELENKNAECQAQFDYYEKHKKWNVDNIGRVVEDRTIVSKNVESKFDASSGYALGDDDLPKIQQAKISTDDDKKTSSGSGISISPPCSTSPSKKNSTSVVAPAEKNSTANGAEMAVSTKSEAAKPGPEKYPKAEGAILAYPAFVEKYEALLEKWMIIRDFEKCKQFLLLHGDVLLQENSSSYLLLASLEDEMNGEREKMLLTCRQSQILTNIAELAKSLRKHPGNVILPFFSRLEQKEFLMNFLEGVDVFVDRVTKRAVAKKKEIDEERAKEREAEGEVDLHTLPKEDRLGPGGFDPVEVFESLPQSMQEAFESRDTEKLKEALLSMSPKDAQLHMDRCVKSGLWNEG